MHGVCGTFGVLAVGIFANGQYGAGWNGTTTAMADPARASSASSTALRPGSASSAPRRIGALVIWTVIFGIAFAFFKIQNALTKGGIRSEEEDELAGLDLPEMGVLAYPEFVGRHRCTGPDVGERSRRLDRRTPSPTSRSDSTTASSTRLGGHGSTVPARSRA